MHDSYRMSPEDIRREGLGKEVRSLLRCGHMDQLYLLSSYLVANPVVLDVDVLGALMMHWIHGKHASDVDHMIMGILQELEYEQIERDDSKTKHQ